MKLQQKESEIVPAIGIKLFRGNALQIESESLNAKIVIDDSGCVHISASAMGGNIFSPTSGLSGNAGFDCTTEKKKPV
jgi:hypothetical protein